MPATFCSASPSSLGRTRAPRPILYYILTYGLTTIGAFGVVGVVERATGSDKLDSFLGLHKRNPLLAAVLLVLFLSLAGIPPLVGFWAKFNLFAAVLGCHVRPAQLPLTPRRSRRRLQRRLALLLFAGAQARLRDARRRRDTDQRPSRHDSSCCSPSPPQSSSWAASRRCCKTGSRASIRDVVARLGARNSGDCHAGCVRSRKRVQDYRSPLRRNQSGIRARPKAASSSSLPAAFADSLTR